MDFEWWRVHGGSLFGTNVPSDEGRWWWGDCLGAGKPLYLLFNFAMNLTLCYTGKSVFKKRTLVYKDFHRGVIYWGENLKASHLSGQIGWLVRPWIECSCLTTKRCLGKAHNLKTCPCAVKRWGTKIYIQYYSVVENKYGVKSVSRGNL